MKIKLGIFFLFLLLNLNTLRGNKIVIQDINEIYGLTKNRVNCMFQDSMGFVWFGMANGLYKFDLNTFTKFNIDKDNINGFPELDVRAIIEAEPGLLIVGTYNKGLLVFNSYTESYDKFKCDSSIDFNTMFVRCMYREKNGAIWIGSNNGLFRVKQIRRGNNQFHMLDIFDRSNTNFITLDFVDIMESQNGDIWFLTMTDIGYYNSIKKSIERHTAYRSNTSFTFLNNNKILKSCFESGLELFNIKTLESEAFQTNGLFENKKVKYVFKDRDNNFWLNISDVVLILLDSTFSRSSLVRISNKNDAFSNLNSNAINKIYETSDGVIWLCTEQGINTIKLIPEIFDSYAFNSNKNPELSIGIRSLLNTQDNYLWVGTIGDGLMRLHKNNNTISKIPLYLNNEMIGNNIQAILKDHLGDIWLGTEGEGIIRFHPNPETGHPLKGISNLRKYPVSFPENTILNDYIMCILQDRQKNIWIGTWDGLSIIDSVELNKKDYSKLVVRNFINDPRNRFSLSNNIVMSLFQDNEGNIWIGTQGGLNKVSLTKNGYKFYNNFKNNKGESLNEKKILITYKDKEGKLWFSTQEGGICYLDENTGLFYEYNSENGFHDNIINSISQDTLGIFWLGTNNGLCRFDPSGNSFNIYKTEDGLLSNDFFYASNCQVDNLLYFGGNRGLTVLNPYEISTSSFEPNLVFTDFRIFNKPIKIKGIGSPLKKHISVLPELTLKYNQNYITLAFAALNYKQQDELKYSCLLEGLETEWNNLDSERKITYTSLKPGTYKFKVRAYSHGHFENSKEIFLPIIIRPPFWRTSVAYIIFLILLVFIIIRIYTYFLNEEKKKHSLAIERMNSKRVHEMDLMKLQFYTNISHELRTPLTLISAPLESLISENFETDKRKSYYELMLKNVNRLKRLIDQLLDLRKIEEGHLKMEWTQGDIMEFLRKIFTSFENYAEKRNIFFTFQANVNQLLTYFDADKLDKVVFNLLSNAFKYTADYGTIALKIDIKNNNQQIKGIQTEKYLEIEVSDSGIGIPYESIPSIFKPFQQVKDNKPIDSTGSGIGLSLTKELIDLHKGTITVKSEVNKGSVFSVKIPFYDEFPEKKDENDKNGNTDLEKNNQTDALVSEVPTESGYDFPKSHVLIVEDNADLRKFISSELNKNFRITEAVNGKEGLEKAFEKIPELIISDVMMNVMDGMEMCRKIKADERTSHIPVILLTARHSEESKQSGFDIGADDYITKPFNISVLRSRITNLIEQRRRLRKLFGQGNNFDISTVTSNKIDSKFIEKLNQVIEKNMDNTGFTPVSLASDMAMSKMQLYRKVSALTNQTVYNYIRAIRMNKAAELLLTTDFQIAEVAIYVGYTEPSNFTKCFYRQFNQTPSQFVRNHKK